MNLLNTQTILHLHSNLLSLQQITHPRLAAFPTGGAGEAGTDAGSSTAMVEAGEAGIDTGSSTATVEASEVDLCATNALTAGDSAGDSSNSLNVTVGEVRTTVSGDEHAE